MRKTPALMLTALLGSFTLAACTEPSGTEGASPSDPSESIGPSEPTGEVYVLDVDTMEGDDNEELSLQRPESMTLTEFSWARDLDWQTWGASSAVATGRISGMFCGADCEGDEYEITLVLCEVSDDHYRRFGVFGDFPEFDDDDWAFGGPLYIGGKPVDDDDWSNGCEEPEPNDPADQA